MEELASLVNQMIKDPEHQQGTDNSGVSADTTLRAVNKNTFWDSADALLIDEASLRGGDN